MIKQNLHTHSMYCDGKNTIEEMVQCALDKQFDVLGFSGHGYHCLDENSMDTHERILYMEEIQKMKEKYRNCISIYLGIEEDLMGHRYDSADFDYIIGSVHFIKYKDTYRAIDHSKEVMDQVLHEEYMDDFLAYAKAYYEEVSKLAEYEEVDIIGHLDLLMKFNEEENYISFEDPVYCALAKACIDRLIQADKIFEVNTGAIARGYRKQPYPAENLLCYIGQHGGKICLNSDCHQKEFLDCFYEESLELIKACGFHSIHVLTKDGFKEERL